MQAPVFKTLLATLALTAAASAARAEVEFLYSCGGDLGFVVTTYPESGRGRFDGPTATDLTPDGQGAWKDATQDIQFWPEGDGPKLFLGSEEFSCEPFADDPGMNAGAEPAAAIPNTADLEMAPYGATKGWDVVAMYSGPDFMGCGGAITQGPGVLALQKKTWGWELRIPADSTEGFSGGVIVVDGKTVDSQFGFTPEGAGEAGLADDFVKVLAQGSTLTTQITGFEPVNWALTGSAAVVTKIEECFAREGVAP